MRRVTIIGCMLAVSLLLLSIVRPGIAKADDVSDAARGVVRVVVAAYGHDGGLLRIGHGSGFAVSANQIVTNAHVVQVTRDYPFASVQVIAAQSTAPTKARLVKLDTSKDLALLETTDSLPALTVSGSPIPDGASVIALGYPGNVDLATADALTDYTAPTDPIRSQGNFSNRRTIDGIDAVLHTAAIARGNSGGPLLDECGRVVGVNSFTTVSGSGDAPFAFAISTKELHAFLRSARQPFTSAVTRCLSLVERAAAEQARVSAEAAEERQRAETAIRARERVEMDAQEDAEALARRSVENWIACALIAGVLGLLAFGAGALLLTKGRKGGAVTSSVAGALLVLGGAAVFFGRPTERDLLDDIPNAAARASELVGSKPEESKSDQTIAAPNAAQTDNSAETVPAAAQAQPDDGTPEIDTGSGTGAGVKEEVEPENPPENINYAEGL